MSATLKILTYPDPFLNKVCRWNFIIPNGFIQMMFDTLDKYDALGLAAPQVGVDARLFITCWGEVFINPQIKEFRGEPHYGPEDCLSFPGVQIFKKRYRSIRVNNQNYEGIKAIVIQHEIDHLNGITLI